DTSSADIDVICVDDARTSMDADVVDAPLSPDAGADAFVAPRVVRPIYDPAALSSAAPFLDFPYPRDLRRDAAGHPVLDGLVLTTDDVPSQRAALVEQETVGFS